MKNKTKSRAITALRAMFALCAMAGAAPARAGGLWEVETADAEGGEVWQHGFAAGGRGRGVYNYVVTARDKAGNEAVSGPFNIKIDPGYGAPAARAVYPENNSVIRQNINMLGVASGSRGVGKVTVRLDGGEAGEAEGAEYWNKLIDFEGVPDGRHSLFVRAFDSEGAGGPEQRINFILDTGPPRIELTSHRIGDSIAKDTVIRGRASDPNGIRKIEASADGKDYRNAAWRRRGNSADFQIPVKIKNMAGGAAVFYVRATDMTGAASARPYLFFISKNGNAGGAAAAPAAPGPALVLNAPGEEEVITEDFEISGAAFGGARAVRWRFLGPKPESIARGPAGREARLAAEAYAADPDVPFSEAAAGGNFSIPAGFAGMADGEYDFEAYAVDSRGGRGETVTRVVRISKSAPETSIASPAITRYNSGAVMVKGFTGDANGVKSVIISLDSGLVWQEVALRDDGSWEIPLNTAAYADGVYPVFVIAEDNYGAASFSNVMINIDNAAPDLSVSFPKSGQYVGTDMRIMGRVSDNIRLKSLGVQIASAENPEKRAALDLPPRLVIFETVSMAGFAPGEYIVRIASKDLADNESAVSRNVFYDPDDRNARVAIYSPLPGEAYSGPVYVSGVVKGTALPEKVWLVMDGREFKELEVDRFGMFRYDISEGEMGAEGRHLVSAYYETDKGRAVSSAVHAVYYSYYGPILLIDSHRDGVSITGRPWLSGRAMFTVPPNADESAGARARARAESSQYIVSGVEVSYDNGRTFKKALGTSEWRWRLEAPDLPPGTQPVVVRAKFANGGEAVRRVLLFVDAEAPKVEALSPAENSRHGGEVMVFGSASDNFDLTGLSVSLRPHDKFWYSVPPALRGLYFDVKVLGATYFDAGVGLSFFDNNVRFQGQYGVSPEAGLYSFFVDGGRYVGGVAGIKLLANIGTIPFDWLLKNRDWAFYKMNFAVGANFSWFEMDGRRPPLYMGAVVGQIDLANVDMKLIYPNWKNYFHVFSLYLQPEIWFASTDAVTDGMGNEIPKTVLRLTFGLRVNVF